MNPCNLFKSLLTAVLLLSSAGAALAQTGNDYTASAEEKKTTRTAPVALSVNAGLCFPYTDVKPAKTTPVFGVGAAWFATSYLHLNLDLQKGWLKSGNKNTTLQQEANSDNSFFSAAATVRFLPLGLGKSKSEILNIFCGLYGGIGLGLISNNVKAGLNPPPDYGSLGTYKGAALMLPVEGGINIPVLLMRHQKRLWINLNYRVNLCFSDKVDGYVPLVTANKRNDAYNTLTAGLVYNF